MRLMVPAPSYTPDHDPLTIFFLITRTSRYLDQRHPPTVSTSCIPHRTPQLTILLLSPLGSRHHTTTPAQARIALPTCDTRTNVLASFHLYHHHAQASKHPSHHASPPPLLFSFCSQVNHAAGPFFVIAVVVYMPSLFFVLSCTSGHRVVHLRSRPDCSS